MRRWLIVFALGGLAFAQAPAKTPPSMAVIGPNQDAANATTSSPVDSDRMWLDLLPQARGQTTLVGGTIRKLDHVRDSVTVHVFGGRDLIILFDDRTHFYRDGLAASASDFRIGDRVYVDTALAGSDIFARSVRVLTQNANGQSDGQVQSYDVASRELILRDNLASEPATFELAPNATVLRDGQPASATELRPGCLVSLKFNPSATGPGVIREISILARPGATFVFAGRVSHLDLHTGLIVLVDPRDSKSYDIHFNPVKTGVEDQLREGGDITVTTTFDGTHYTANSIVINPAPVK
jgi:hypothetical protein